MKADDVFILDQEGAQPEETPHIKPYLEEALLLNERTFESLLKLAARRLKLMGFAGVAESQQLYESLNRGTAILQTEEQLDKYMQSFGRKHYIKFQTLFNSVPKNIFDGFFDLVDWGSGPGLGIIALDAFCRKTLGRTIESQVREITLIEPSAVSLERAKIHVDLFFPESAVKSINKRFEALAKVDFAPTAVGVPRLHLFSNVLDLDLFAQGQNRNYIFDLVKDAFQYDEFFLCVSPTYNDIAKTFMAFISSLINSDIKQETLLEPTEKVFTKELDGSDVRMTGVAVRVRNKKVADRLGQIKNIPLLSALNARRDSNAAQRALVNFISMQCASGEYDILYRPNLMGDCPDMLVLKKGTKAKIIYVCDVEDASAESMKLIMDVARVADCLKYRLFDLISRALQVALHNSRTAYGLVQCVLYMPKLQIDEARLKRMLVDCECAMRGDPQQLRKIDNEWNYRRLYTGQSEWKNDAHGGMSDDLYMDLKHILVPTMTVAKQGVITFKRGSKQERVAISVAGERKKVFGVYGSGKTTVMVARAISAYHRTHKMIVILTFNITLRGYIENLLLRQFGAFNRNQFYVVNYHEFIKAECHSIGLTQDIPYDDYVFFSERRDKFRKYGVIFIDEAQDYSVKWFRIIADVFLADRGEYLLFGDEKQNIYGNPIDEKDRKIKTNISGSPITLTGCFRSNAAIVERITQFQKLFHSKYDVSEIECCEEGRFYGLLGKTGVFDVEAGKSDVLLHTILKIHKDYELPPSDTAVLGSSIELLRRIEKSYRDVSASETECMFITQEDYDSLVRQGHSDSQVDLRERGIKLHFDANKPVLKFSTIHSYKGFESNTIIVIIQRQVREKEDTELELIYTGLTRAGRNLFIINYGQPQHAERLKQIFGVCK